MKEEIKNSRKRIDALLQVLKNYQQSREYYKAYDSLQLGFMRLGLVLGELGSETPYPESMKVESNVIHPPSDRAEENTIPVPDGEVAQVKYFRVLIDTEITFLHELFDSYMKKESVSYHLHHLFENATSCLSDSKMWFGQVLNNIREGELKYQEFLKDNTAKMKAEVVAAYTRYGGVTDFKNFQGNPMPEFDALPEKIQQAWYAAVQPRDRSIDMGASIGRTLDSNRCL